MPNVNRLKSSRSLGCTLSLVCPPCDCVRRYDLLCLEGLSRALRIFLGKEKVPDFRLSISEEEAFQGKKPLLQMTARPEVGKPCVGPTVHRRSSSQGEVSLLEIPSVSPWSLPCPPPAAALMPPLVVAATVLRYLYLVR